MEIARNLDPTTLVVVVFAVLVIALVLFAKVIHGVLKLAIIAAMVGIMLYFLRQAGVV